MSDVKPQRPAGWYRSMEPAWATEHYDFPTDPTAGDRHTAADNSEWTFDLVGNGDWDLSRYAPDETEKGIRLFDDPARKAPVADQTPREELAEIIKRETGMSYTSKTAADRIIAEGWRPPARVIEDPVELDMLPVGSIVAVGEGVATTRFSDGWYVTGEYWDLRSESDELIERCGAVTVLHAREVLP